MPPRSRFHLPLGAWTLIACVAGLLGGRWLASYPHCFSGLFLLQAIRLLAQIALATGKCLAIPLIFASIVRGADGLEPMRGVGRLALKTGAWIAGSAGVAALTGLVAGLVLRPASGAPVSFGPRLVGPDNSFAGEIWIACVLVALALGVYRNQIEEIRSRLLLRFATGIDEALTLLLDWASGIIPAAVFCLALTTAANSVPDLQDAVQRLPGLLGALAVGWAIYGLLLLPLGLLVLARVNPWRYAFAIGPAVLAALAGGSPPEVFALTLARVRGRAGVSNRVGSVALSGCTALLRDGLALGWALAGAWLIPASGHPGQSIKIFLAAWLLGCAGAAVSGLAAPLLLLGAAAEPDAGLALTIGALVALVGNALSVFSQACAAAVIARSEGEVNLLPPRPPTASLADVLLEPPFS